MIKKLIYFIMCVLGSLSTVWADAPEEQHHFKLRELSAQTLKNTVGVLTISSGIKRGTELHIWSKRGNNYYQRQTIQILSETKPLTNFGYNPPIPSDSLSISAYRFPICAVDNNFICIIYDPVKYLTAWIHINEVKRNFDHSIVLFSNIKNDPNYSFFIDITTFYPGNKKRKIYTHPDTTSSFTTLDKLPPNMSGLFRSVEQQGDFFKIESYDIDYSNGKEIVKPVGWIKIHDSTGNFTIWIYNVDLC